MTDRKPARERRPATAERTRQNVLALVDGMCTATDNVRVLLTDYARACGRQDVAKNLNAHAAWLIFWLDELRRKSPPQTPATHQREKP